jgi:hypothetical protein
MDFFSSGNGQDRFPLYGPLDTLHSDSEGHIWIGAGRYGVADGAQPASYERQFVSYDGSTWQSFFCRAQETGAFYCGVPYPPSGSDSAALAPIVVLKHGVITGEYDQIMDHLAGDIMSVALDPLGRSWIGTTRGLSVKAAEMFQPARDEVSVVYHDVSAYSPGGTHVYDPGVLPWLDLLVRLDDEWYGPERQVGDEIGAYPLDQAGAFRWEASGAFSTLPNGEAWWNESGNQGIVTLYDPDHKSVYSVALEIRFKNDPMYESVAQVQPSDSPACDILADGLELRPHDSPPLTKSWLVKGMRLTPLARDLDGTSLQVQLPTGQVSWLSADLGSLDCGRLNLDHLPVSEPASHGTYRATSSAFKAWVTDLQPGSKSYNLQLHNTGNALFVTYAEAISIVDNLGNHYEPDCLQMACGQLWIGNNIPFQLSGTLKQPIDPSATRVILSLAVQEPPDVGPSDYVLIWQQDIALQIWQLDR